MSPPDVTAIIVFHKEGLLAVPALDSFSEMVNFAEFGGLRVQPIVLLDAPDALTLSVIRRRGQWVDETHVLDFKDLGETRNFGVRVSKGEFIAFFDGDDLWDLEWLSRASELARISPEAVWHPEWLFYFDENDFNRHSTGRLADPGARSFFFKHISTRDPTFRPEALIFNNLWSANCLAQRDIMVTFPYSKVNIANGIGIEDWTWNIDTVLGGIEHDVVPGVVHAIRVKSTESLSGKNVASRLIPRIPPELFELSKSASESQTDYRK